MGGAGARGMVCGSFLTCSSELAAAGVCLILNPRSSVAAAAGSISSLLPALVASQVLTGSPHKPGPAMAGTKSKGGTAWAQASLSFARAYTATET